MKLFKDLKDPKPNYDDPLRFGKHKGMTPEEVAEIDPGWVVWAYDTCNPKPCSKALAIDCEYEENEKDYPDGMGYKGDC